MNIYYKKKSLRNICENQEIFEKEYPHASFKQFKKAKNYIIASKNIDQVKKYKGLKIKKLKGKKNIGSFRLNKSVRVNFKFKNSKDFLEIEEITIEKIHNHKY